MLYMLAAQLNYFMVRFLKLVNFIYFYGCLTESLLLHMVLFQYGRGHGLTFCFLVTEREEINFFFLSNDLHILQTTIILNNKQKYN